MAGNAAPDLTEFLRKINCLKPNEELIEARGSLFKLTGLNHAAFLSDRVRAAFRGGLIRPCR